MDNFRIMTIKDEDLLECVNTIRSAFAVNAKIFGFTKQNYPSSGAFITLEDLQMAKARNVHMYGVWIENEIAGYVQLERKGEDTYSFQKFAVLPEYRQLGIGKALIAFCKNKATIYGAKKISLIMVLENERLLNIYLESGFKLIGTKEDDAHPFVQGVMELTL
ncbi:MAG: GNAT family N-acetyltransferase [Clostridia bacterium]